MTNLKVGDRVVCIDKGFNSHITLNKEYEIIDITEYYNFILIVNDINVKYYYDSVLFKKVEEPSKEKYTVKYGILKKFDTQEEALKYIKNNSNIYSEKEATICKIVAEYESKEKIIYEWKKKP
jgi:hypothetical protein